MVRHSSEYGLNEISMGIHETQPVSSGNILERDIKQQVALTGAVDAENVGALPPTDGRKRYVVLVAEIRSQKRQCFPPGVEPALVAPAEP